MRARPGHSSSRSTSRNRHLQREARPFGIVGGDDAEKLGAIVEFDRVGFLEAPGDGQFVVLEQAAKIVLQHGTADRQCHREGERAVAILVVDRDRSELAFAERHVRRLGGLRIRRDFQRRRAKGTAQKLTQFRDLGFVHVFFLAPPGAPRGCHEALPRCKASNPPQPSISTGIDALALVPR